MQWVSNFTIPKKKNYIIGSCELSMAGETDTTLYEWLSIVLE